jgi:hypothetical protein
MARDEGAVEHLAARGTVPVFPLPDVVCFPHATLPLHVFEPRYRRMTEDALRADRLIAMALLKPGWERDYDGNPEIHPIACAGVIEDEIRLPDGRFNIRLRGLARVEVQAFVQESPYRVASVKVLEDRNADDGPLVDREKRRLLASCASLLQEVSGRPGRPIALDSDVPFAVVVNSLCQSLEMDADVKQGLLALDDVVQRCGALIGILDRRWREIALRQGGRDAPPGHGVH